jgi:hypothetical protein
MSKKFEEKENGLIVPRSTVEEKSSLKTTCHQANNLDFDSLFRKLPGELILCITVYLNLADLFVFRRVCHQAKNLNVSDALKNVSRKPLPPGERDTMQFLVWRSSLGLLALDMQMRDISLDLKPEEKIATLRFEPKSYEIPPEIIKKISVEFFNSIKPQLEKKNKVAEKNSCLIL